MLKDLDPSIEVSFQNIEKFKTDYSSISGEMPDAVVWPKSDADCKAIIDWANKSKTTIIIRGAGSGTTGGASALSQSVVVCFDKMNKILDFDEKNATLSLEPGVIIKTVHDLVESKGLFYPPDPASLAMCTIGGNVAENAGGPRALKYGVTRDYIIGLKGYWANGEPFSYGGKLKKNVAGYDLISLIVGSEGTLALITEITLKLIPKPPVIMEALSTFKSAKDALDTLIRVKQLGINPATAEFMTDICVDAALSYTNETPQFKLNKAYIIWQFDGITDNDVFDQLIQVRNLCGDSTWFPMDSIQRADHVWRIRRNISLGLKMLAGKKYSEDIVVPISNIPEVIEALENMQHKSGIKVLGYGHLGDGNIHVNILKMSASNKDWETYAPDVIDAVMRLAMSFGGSISGEHGIGLTKKQYMPLMFSPHDLSVMKNIKELVDPNNILNSGKMISE